MYKRFNELSFVIGLFFVLASVVLFGGYFFSDHSNQKINLYTGFIFLLFGIVMMLLHSNEKENADS
jgi:putative Ca2+/H+ antiporter (TMEM165/GDT1 family)